MRILSITSNDLGISWGPAIHYLELWRRVSAMCRDVVVEGVAPSWTGARPIIEPGIKLRIVPVPNVPAWRQVYYDAVVAGRLLLSGRRFDLVYVRLSHWHVLQIAVLFLLRLAFVVELNGLAEEDAISSKKYRFARSLVKAQEKWLVTNAELAIAVSEGIATSVRRRYPSQKRVVTISNGVGEHLFQDRVERANFGGNPTVIYVGTFTPWDGASEVVSLARHFQEVKFLMVGDGPGRQQLESTATPNVEFVGYVSYNTLPEIYSRADAAIVLYEFERHRNVEVSSLKTREYLASGLPIFSTDVPGQGFIEELGVGMLLGRDQNAIHTFAAFLQRLPEHYRAYDAVREELRETIGWNATARETVRALGMLSSRTTVLLEAQ